MPFREIREIRYHTFESFEEAGILHGSITRCGGVSPQPWQSLNVGGTVGDERGNVLENMTRIFRAFDRPLESRYDVWQVHSADVVCTDSARPADQAHLKADAILTDTPGVTLFMRFADCVPVFLLDPVRKVAGLVHAGWLGTVDQAVTEAVKAMRSRYASRPEDLLAGIGPSIGPDHYEVGPDVIERVKRTFGSDAESLLHGLNGSGAISGVKFDLWSANRLLLERAGVRKIEIASVCTACHLGDWYSHRGEKGKTGRFGALIGF